METNYDNYTAIEFAKDEYFLQWYFLQDEKSNLFWKSYMEEHPEQMTEVERAIAILDSVQEVKPSFTSNEKKEALVKLKAKYLRSDQKKAKVQSSVYSVVACAAIIFFIGWFYHYKKADVLLSETPIFISDNEIVPDKIQLIVGDSTLVLEDDAEILFDQEGYIEIPGRQKVKGKEEKAVWNKLIVPNGRRSSLLLADGSKVWINSGSTLEFPSVFDEGKREIVIAGEIYIEVARDENQPFFVLTDHLKIEVLGTKFNVSAYNDEKETSVVLVEGLVSATTSFGDSRRLTKNNRMTVSGHGVKVENVSIYKYISWKDGILCFDGDSLDSILQKIARYYDADIVYDESVGDLKCSGKLVLMDNIEDVLENISVISPITYNRNENQIIINMNNK